MDQVMESRQPGKAWEGAEPGVSVRQHRGISGTSRGDDRAGDAAIRENQPLIIGGGLIPTEKKTNDVEFPLISARRFVSLELLTFEVGRLATFSAEKALLFVR